MYYPDEVIDRVMESSNIVDVIGSYVKLKRRGSSYMGLCPFHNEKTPSFSVSPDKQLYYCFGCGAGGNVFTFLMQYENMTFQEAVQYLADRAGISLPEPQESEEQKRHRSRRQALLEINKTAAVYYYRNLQGSEGAQARRYFEERKLSHETQVHFGLGYSSKFSSELYTYLKSRGYSDELLNASGLVVFDEKSGVHDRFWNRVMFPIMDAGSRVIGFGGRVMGDGKPKYLNSPETEIFDKSRNLYGLNFARSARKPYFIICEGYMDVIAMHQAGFTCAVASLGTAFTSQHAAVIRHYVGEVRLAYDSDEAGQRAALRAIPMLRNAGIAARVIHMEPYKDPDEFIKNLGREEFQKRIDDAQSGFMFEIDSTAKRHRLSDPDERTAFIRETARRLLEFPEKVERDVYIESIASTYGIDSAALGKMVDSLGSSLSQEQIEDLREKADSFYENPDRSRKKSGDEERPDRIRASQKILLTYIVQYRDVYEKLKGNVTEDDFPDPFFHEAAKLVFSEYETSGHLNPARIVGGFEDASQQQEAAALFSDRISGGDDPALRDKMISDVIRNIRRYRQKNALKTSTTMEQVMDAYARIKKKNA